MGSSRILIEQLERGFEIMRSRHLDKYAAVPRGFIRDVRASAASALLPAENFGGEGDADGEG